MESQVSIKPETAALPPPQPWRRVRLRYVVAALAVLALAAAVTFYCIRFVVPYETTDDAFVDGYVTFISPRVAGPVTRLRVNDNQRVKAGDILVEIDPRDFETRVAQAQADRAAAAARLHEARAQVTVDRAKLDQQQADLVAAEAKAARAEADRARYEAVRSEAISRSRLDLAKTEARSATAEAEAARGRAGAAAAQLEADGASIDVATAQVQQAQARLQQAELDLSYTKVRAPLDGRVTARTVQEGNYVEIGRDLLSIVPNELWVVANFKETQLTHMRPGQPVTIRIDAYPQYELTGRVDSLQAGSGARFSLLPPENAVGNYVKVVQRVPVKIVFDQPVNTAGLDIAPGMSVEPKVRVR